MLLTWAPTLFMSQMYRHQWLFGLFEHPPADPFKPYDLGSACLTCRVGLLVPAAFHRFYEQQDGFRGQQGRLSNSAHSGPTLHSTAVDGIGLFEHTKLKSQNISFNQSIVACSFQGLGSASEQII